LLYRELDGLGVLRREAKQAMLAEAGRHRGHEVLQRVPAIGPVRAAQILSAVGTPYRFRTKRQLRAVLWFRSRDPRDGAIAVFRREAGEGAAASDETGVESEP